MLPVAFYVYILASRRNGTLYIGHTDSISRRTWEHREGETPSFTRRYGVDKLVYYEAFETRSAAFHRERAMKKWRRAWKLELIERFNPAWEDITEDLPLE
jgi:putative endonuclease